MCKCLEDMEPKLAEHNAAFVLNLFDPTYAFIAVEKRDSKKRAKPPYLAASFCPFCGEKYPARETRPAKSQPSEE